MRRPPVRAAFTLIELLVVIAIIAILMSLLMAGVQQARGAATRIACGNNLHQLAIAVHVYDSDFGNFPPAAVWSYDASGSTGTQTYVRRSMWCDLLPYIEEGNIGFRFDKQWSKPENAAAVAVPIKVYQCPAAPNPRFITGTSGQQATGDYAPLAGAKVSEVSAVLSQSHGLVQNFIAGSNDSVGNIYPGFFNNINTDADPRTGFSDITDGTSNTIMLIECSGRNDLYIGKWKNASLALSDDDNPDSSTLSAGRTTGGPWAQPRGQVVISGFNKTSNTYGGPDFINATNAGEVFSFHTNVANFAFGDGSVRTLKQGINPDTFISLVTRQGGEAASAP